MAATYSQLAQITQQADFQNRVAVGMSLAATQVASESSSAATSALSAAGSKTLTFTAVPSWVGVGGGVTDLTTPAAILASTIITAVTSTTVTLSAPIATGGVASGDTIFFSQHATRAAFATRVLNGNYSLSAACLGVVGNSTIQSEANPAVVGDNIPDSDIQFQINAIWNALAGA